MECFVVCQDNIDIAIHYQYSESLILTETSFESGIYFATNCVIFPPISHVKLCLYTLYRSTIGFF